MKQILKTFSFEYNNQVEDLLEEKNGRMCPLDMDTLPSS